MITLRKEPFGQLKTRRYGDKKNIRQEGTPSVFGLIKIIHFLRVAIFQHQLIKVLKTIPCIVFQVGSAFFGPFSGGGLQHQRVIFNCDWVVSPFDPDFYRQIPIFDGPVQRQSTRRCHANISHPVSVRLVQREPNSERRCRQRDTEPTTHWCYPDGGSSGQRSR